MNLKKACVGAIVAARFSSSRLPGKAMLHLGGHSVLGLLLARLKQSKLLDKIVLATSSQCDDDLLEIVAKQYGVSVYRGSLNDVVDRYANAAKLFEIDTVVRITGDNPFVNGAYVDYFLDQIKDNLSTLYTTRPKCPKGMNVEIFSTEMLHYLNLKKNLSDYHREHLTSWFYTRESLWQPVELQLPFPNSEKSISFSIDTAEEFVNATKVINETGKNILCLNVDDIDSAYKKCKAIK